MSEIRDGLSAGGTVPLAANSGWDRHGPTWDSQQLFGANRVFALPMVAPARESVPGVPGNADFVPLSSRPKTPVFWGFVPTVPTVHSKFKNYARMHARFTEESWGIWVGHPGHPKNCHPLWLATTTAEISCGEGALATVPAPQQARVEAVDVGQPRGSSGTSDIPAEHTELDCLEDWHLDADPCPARSSAVDGPSEGGSSCQRHEPRAAPADAAAEESV